MRMLLDTQVLLWAIYSPEKLRGEWPARLRSRANPVFFSAVSITEIAIKASLGREDFPFRPGEVEQAARASGFEELPLIAGQANRLVDLPWHHRDPFDRMLIVQAIEEGLRLITADKVLAAYSDLVEVV